MRRWLGLGLKNGLYAFVTVLSAVIVRVAFRLRVRGKGNFDPDGEYIIVARHRSYWDVFVLATSFGAFRRIHFIARKGLMRGNPLVQPVIRCLATIIDRERFGRSDFREMLEAIKRERLVGIFPEGTTREHVDAKAGAVRFATLTQKKILPVNIRANGAYPPHYPFGFPRLTVSIGAPFSAQDLAQRVGEIESRAERTQAMSRELMLRVDNA